MPNRSTQTRSERRLVAVIRRFFATGADQALVSDNPEVIRRLYERKRWSVFLAVTFGYGLFYVARINFSVVKEPLLRQGLLDGTEMGIIGSAMLMFYAVGKLVNGFLSDRANIRRFMASALLASAVVNLLLGFTTLFVFFVVLWGLNGWFQSVGSAPSVVALTQWFSNRERGTRYGVWSVSHSIGEGLTFAVTAALVSMWGWRWGFWGPGLLCVAAALVLYRTLADRPETYGLPSVAEYKDDHSAEPSENTVGRQQAEVLKNPAVWALGLSSAAMYVARYGINNWGVLYLQMGKGYSLIEAGSVMAAYPILGILGAAASGWFSDRFFGARRNVPTLLFGLLVSGSLIALFAIPPGHPFIDASAMGVFGFALGGLLVYLGGLMAVDIVPRRAAGAAMGVVGLFSYMGAALQDTVSGYLVDMGRVVIDGEAAHAAVRLCNEAAASTLSGLGGFAARIGASFLDPTSPTAVGIEDPGAIIRYDFSSVTTFWLGASVLSIVLALTVWRVRPKD